MTETAVATKTAPNRLLPLWSSVIGKKVVMAVTGAVLVLFVIAHMAGNLKIFSGPEEINAYSRFLREVGYPEFELRPTSVDRAQRAAGLRGAAHHGRLPAYDDEPPGASGRITRPRKNVETTWGALTMRWGGVLLARFYRVPPVPLHRRRGGISARAVRTPDRLSECGRRLFQCGRSRSSTSWPWALSACTWITASGAACRRSAG